jgi:four helix bundle protein
MLIRNFEDLDIFKVSRQFIKEIYICTRNQKFVKDPGLRNQIQRASVSIILNLAEGFDSGGPKSAISFLKYSYRSASEVRAILYIALDINYITLDEFNGHKSKLLRIQKMLSRLIKHLEKRI